MYQIRQATKSDIGTIVNIYNSNPQFLHNHLGFQLVDYKFIFNEMQQMNSRGFVSCVIVEQSTNTLVGMLDYKPNSPVYLSVLMIDYKRQKVELAC